jgi:hypothetical protein
VLTLFLLAPLTAEALTGSTPIFDFLTHPFSLLYLPALYGSGALLARELVRRRRLGWPNLLLLGAAYGILEEGLVVTSWFNPFWPDVCQRAQHPPTGLCDYGRMAQTNLVWALSLTLFHAVCSVAIPILLTERLFPQRARAPWLGRRGEFFFILSLVVASFIGLLFFGFLGFRAQGYAHPPLIPYLAALLLAVGLVWLGLRLRIRPPAHVLGRPWAALTASGARRAPRAWLLRLFGFGMTVIWLALPGMLQGAHVPSGITLALGAALTAGVVWLVLRWSRRPGWSATEELALATGVLGFFILVFAPILELAGQINGEITRGTLALAALYLIGLILLARRTRRSAAPAHR